jgi:two-component system sensor histidine kinase/response regulator
MKQGAYDYLPKPFTPDEFRLITKRGLEKRDLVLQTISLRREKELLRENFAAIVSHELRSPLSAVQQNLFNLAFELSDQVSEDQQRRLDRMKTRISDLLEMISTWLRVIKTDIESIKENFKPTSLENVIEKAAESVQTHAVRKNIDIVTEIEEPISQVFGEEGTLTETIVNILINAIKYSQNNSQVFLSAGQKEDTVIISICDTGVGISDDDLPHIFDDFYSGKSSQPSERGSGIGLALSRRIIETHNGTITVDSEFGKGSTFEIQLPAYQITN